MITTSLLSQVQETLSEIQEAGLEKRERLIASPQDAEVTLADGSKVINVCANNYLGLSNHPEVKDAAQAAISEYGYGLSSCLLYTSPSPRDQRGSRMPSSA